MKSLTCGCLYEGRGRPGRFREFAYAVPTDYIIGLFLFAHRL